MQLSSALPTLPIKVVRPILENGSPQCKIWTAQDINNVRIKIRYLKQILGPDQTHSFESFARSFKNEEFDSYFTDDHNGFADSISFESRSLLEQMQKDDLNSECPDLESGNTIDSLNRIYKGSDDTFDYRLQLDNKGMINGIVWMNGAMRDAFDRFGTMINLDAMKHSFNTHLLPYISVTMRRDTDNLSIACEGLVAMEDKDAYAFLLRSLFEMTVTRKRSEVLVVAGDGFFNQSMMKNNFELPNAMYLQDHWHLTNRNLPDNIAKYRFDKVKQELTGMVYAKNETIFNENYARVMTILRENNASAQEICYVEQFAKHKKHYAFYLLRLMPGSFGYLGSSIAEANHSSIHARFGKEYCQHPTRMEADLIDRGRGLQNSLNKELLEGSLKLSVCNRLETNDAQLYLASSSVEDKTLSYVGFTRFKKEVMESRLLEVENLVNGKFRVGTRGEAFWIDFDTRDARCICPIAVADMIQCRHEYKLDPTFKLCYFDKRYYFRPARVGVLRKRM